jgi:hypothetical protein
VCGVNDYTASFPIAPCLPSDKGHNGPPDDRDRIESISSLKQRAVAIKDYVEVIIRDDTRCPTLPADQVCIRVDADALNTSDMKMRGAFATP